MYNLNITHMFRTFCYTVSVCQSTVQGECCFGLPKHNSPYSHALHLLVPQITKWDTIVQSRVRMIADKFSCQWLYSYVALRVGRFAMFPGVGWGGMWWGGWGGVGSRRPKADKTWGVCVCVGGWGPTPATTRLVFCQRRVRWLIIIPPIINKLI
jgi:hypothetical protein